MKQKNEIIPYCCGMKLGIFFFFLFSIFISVLFSRIPIECVKTSAPPKIDGVLDDTVWSTARGYNAFKSYYPDFGKLPKEKTIVYWAYDADHLYFAFKCYESDPGKIIGTIRKRDTIQSEDLVALLIDSHNDGQNAYSFAMNPRGIQSDGIMDSQSNLDSLPDFIWDSAGVINNDGYSVEAKIPFKALRFANKKIVKMRIGFFRKITRYSEQYAFPEWQAIGSGLGYLGFCQFEGIKYQRILHVLPSFTYMNRRGRNVGDTLDSFNEKSLGLTSKIGVTSNLTLDITLNPDFSHIEIDEGQVDVNLRVEPLYKEKRPFFLEGLEHFNFAGCGYGSHIEKIVHTRNIIEPSWGLKLSGKIGRSNVINSLFSVDEARNYSDFDGLDTGDERGSNYYGILRYKHLVKNDSYVGAIYTGKEFKINSGSEEGEAIRGFNRVVGMDSRVRFSGFLLLDAYYLYSFNNLYDKDRDAVDKNGGAAFGGRLKYEDRKNLVTLGYHQLATNFELASGRLLRNGIKSFSPELARYIYPKSDFLKLITLSYSGRMSRDTKYNMNEYVHQFMVEFQLPLSTRLFLGYDLATEVFNGGLFNKNTFLTSAASRPSKHLQLEIAYSTGRFPYYDPVSPYQGYLKIFSIIVDFHPNEQFSTQFMWQNHIFHGNELSTGDYNFSIYRNKTIFQVNKYLSLRGIVEYDSIEKRIIGDGLVEFTYIPGTVIHMGYGTTFSKEAWVDGRYLYYDRYKEVRSSLFFKASYLFRF